MDVPDTPSANTTPPASATAESATRLDAVAQLINLAMLADQPGARKRLQGLHRRVRQGKPVDRGLDGLQKSLHKSVARRRARGESAPDIAFPDALPIVARLADIRSALEQHQVIVVCGETGSGKSTQLPKMCLSMGRGTAGDIGHTQPRRLAARTLSARIASELSEPALVGYQVRFDDKTGPRCRVRLMTDGILLNELRRDPLLLRYDTLIVDEAHERSLNIDFLLGYLKQLLPRRADLKLIVTSATIDPEAFSKHFSNAPVVEVSGRGFPVEVIYHAPGNEAQGPGAPETEADANGHADGPGNGAGDVPSDGDNLAIAQALDLVRATEQGKRGDVLVFLPGERQIRDATRFLEKHNPKLKVLPLYARLSGEQQQRVFEKAGTGRVVLATNVAETSLTVPGVTAVIDSGVARISRYARRSKIQRLPIERISQASADQRKGRCGRVAPGVCVRLYSQDDFEARAPFTEPEIVRTNLASVILRMSALKLGDIEAFPFVEPPDRRLISDGYRLLQMLQAVDEERQVTALGERMARLPVDPRLARALLAASERECLAEVLIVVAALSVQDPRQRPEGKARQADEGHAVFIEKDSDFMSLWNLWHAFELKRRASSGSQLRKWCRKHYLSWHRIQEWRDLHRQLSEYVPSMGLIINTHGAPPSHIHRALLTGFIDRVGRRADDRNYDAPRGLSFRIFPGSVLATRRPRWVMAASILQISHAFAMTTARIRRAWLEEAGGHLLKQRYYGAHWNEARGRVDAFEEALLFGIAVYSKRRVPFGPIVPHEARGVFIQEALVADRSRSRARFRRHNRRLRGELERTEHKLRVRDVLASDSELYAFFDRLIPSDMSSMRAFERWRRKVEKQQPALLHMDVQDMRRPEAPSASTAAYPDTFRLAGNILKLQYNFAPGRAEDGVTLRIPALLLHELKQYQLDRMVPAYLREAIVAVLRGLPKRLRKTFPPLPQTLEAIEHEVRLDTQPLRISVCDALNAHFRCALSAQAFADITLEPHLHPRLCVIGRDGKLLDSGRDLAVLQRRFADARTARPAPSPAWQRSGLREWDFGALPAQVQVSEGDISVQCYPTLLDQGKAVDMALSRDQRFAEHATRDGIARLCMLAMPQQVKALQQRFSGDRKMVLQAQALGSLTSLGDDLVFRVFRDNFVSEEDALPRNREAYVERFELRRAQLMNNAEQMFDLLSTVLSDWHVLRLRLLELPARWEQMDNDIRIQVHGLMSPGFLRTTPHEWLSEYPRYFKALARRLERAELAYARDQQLTEQLTPLVRRYENLLDALADARLSPVLRYPALSQYRWMLEEYRVSLFSQPVKTRMPVSPKRLDKQWALVIQACGKPPGYNVEK